MKKAVTQFFVSCLFISGAWSQPIITGKVVASSNGAPIPGSSVFIANTTKGTTADKDGNFELTDIPPGRHELIISSIGYETNVFSFGAEQLPLKLRIEMDIKVKELANVVVEPSEEGNWNKWGKTFLDNFIGTTANAANCKIKNTESIKFRYYKKSNRLTAYCEEPLIIENRALGYRLSFQLEDFEVKFRERTSVFTGYPLFDEIDKDRKEIRNKWKKARERAYNGSIMHFMRSLYSNKLQEEGFEVRRMHRELNVEKERVKKLLRERMAQNGHVVMGSVSSFPGGDSSEYYRGVLQQPDFTDSYDAALLNADSLIVQSEEKYKVLFFSEYLFITYKNGREESGYATSFREMRNPGLQRSFIILIDDQPIALDINGTYYPTQKMYSGGYWGWSEKIGNMLPLDYKITD